MTKLKGYAGLVFTLLVLTLSACTNNQPNTQPAPDLLPQPLEAPATPTSEVVQPSETEPQPQPYALASKQSLTPQQVSDIIARSRANYPGKCGCPDDVDRAGRRCGKRSAYSRAGGAQVLCYPEDVQQSLGP